MCPSKITFNFQIYFKSDFTRLKIFGVWINDGTKKPRLYPLYFCVINVLFTLFFNVLQVINLCYTSDGLKSVASSGYVIAVCFMSNIRSFYIFRNRLHFEEIATALNDDILQPKNNFQLILIEEALNFYLRIKTFLLVTCSISVFSALTTPLFYKKIDQNLPMSAWYPFDTSTFLMHTVVYVHQCISVFYVSYINIYVDIVFAGLATFIALQCDLLCDNLTKILKENSLNECVTHHRKILL